MSKCWWENGAERLARRRAAIDLQFVKNTGSVKLGQAKQNKTRSVYIE